MAVVALVCVAPFVAIVGLLVHNVIDIERAERQPDYERVQATLSGSVGPNGDLIVDLAQVHSGTWDTACILGGYSQPDLTLRPYSDEADRFAGHYVHENEAAIATVRKGTITYVRRLSPPVNLQEFRCCTSRDSPRVRLGEAKDTTFTLTARTCPVADTD